MSVYGNGPCVGIFVWLRSGVVGGCDNALSRSVTSHNPVTPAQWRPRRTPPPTSATTTTILSSSPPPASTTLCNTYPRARPPAHGNNFLERSSGMLSMSLIGLRHRRLNVLSRLITTYYLLDASATGYCPNAWEPRELWPQRFAFTTLRDALEVERMMHLFPAWKCHRECLCSSHPWLGARVCWGAFVEDGWLGCHERVAPRRVLALLPRLLPPEASSRCCLGMRTTMLASRFPASVPHTILRPCRSSHAFIS